MHKLSVNLVPKRRVIHEQESNDNIGILGSIVFVRKGFPND